MTVGERGGSNTNVQKVEEFVLSLALVVVLVALALVALGVLVAFVLALALALVRTLALALSLAQTFIGQHRCPIRWEDCSMTTATETKILRYPY